MKANPIKTTYELLLEEHKQRYVPLSAIGPYMGVTDDQQLRLLALKKKLGGIRAFKLRDSQKAPLLVDLENVADELDRRSIAMRD